MELQVDDNYLFVAAFIILILAFVVATIVQPASAYTYVMQGDTVSLGDTVDLSGVYGWSGMLGWWKNSYYEGGLTTPDAIVDLNSYQSYEKVYLDPAVFKVGNWYQWDGLKADTHANTFVFKITPQVNFTITGKTSTPVKVNTTDTQEPQQTIPPILQTPVPTISIPIPVLTPVPVRTLPPPRGLPTEPVVVAVAVIGAALLFLWFRER